MSPKWSHLLGAGGDSYKVTDKSSYLFKKMHFLFNPRSRASKMGASQWQFADAGSDKEKTEDQFILPVLSKIVVITFDVDSYLFNL